MMNRVIGAVRMPVFYGVVWLGSLAYFPAFTRESEPVPPPAEASESSPETPAEPDENLWSRMGIQRKNPLSPRQTPPIPLGGQRAAC